MVNENHEMSNRAKTIIFVTTAAPDREGRKIDIAALEHFHGFAICHIHGAQFRRADRIHHLRFGLRLPFSVEETGRTLRLADDLSERGQGSGEKETSGVKLDGGTFWLRVRVQVNDHFVFSSCELNLS